MNAPDILRAGIAAMEDRAASRDVPAERSMIRAVHAFNALFAREVAASGGLLSEVHGWRFMEILKLARGVGLDEFVDGAAYAALAGEAAMRETPPSPVEPPQIPASVSGVSAQGQTPEAATERKTGFSFDAKAALERALANRDRVIDEDDGA